MDAFRLAQLCSFSYGPSLDVPCMPSWVEDSQFFEGGFVCRAGSTIAIVFRGTADKADWYTDLQVEMLPFGVGHAHRGFLERANADMGFWLSALNKVRNRAPHACRIICTGHSLGGALATLFAAYLQPLCANVSAVTFGSPRVFDASAANDFNLAIAHDRYVAVRDPVPRVPWIGIELPPRDYVHCGTERPLPVAFTERAADRIRGLRLLWAEINAGVRVALRLGIQFHGIQHYCDLLGRADLSQESAAA